MEKSVEEAKIASANSPTEAQNRENSEAKPTKTSILERSIGEVLSGNIFNKSEVKRQYPYVFFVALLMLLYIANGFNIQKLHRQNDRLAKEVKELRAKSLTIASIRMSATRQSAIIEELNARGIPLEESLTPSKVVVK